MPLITDRRTCLCGDVRTSHTGQEVTLKGWIHRWRDHGGIIFIDLRDRAGLVQLVFDPEVLSAELFERVSHLRSEAVLAIPDGVTRFK